MNVHLVGILHSDASYVDAMFADGSTALSHSLELFRNLSYNKEAEKYGHINNCSIVSIEGAKPITVPDDMSYVLIPNTLNALIDALLAIRKKDINIKNATVQSTDSDMYTGTPDSYNTSYCITSIDNVFQDSMIFQKTLHSHKVYKAHYTYIEGYPKGISPECISLEGVELIHELLYQHKDMQSNKINRSSIFSLIEKRIHDFDIQTEIAPQDMRMYRLELTANTQRNYSITKRLWDSGFRNIDNLSQVYQDNSELFIGPASFYYLQVSNHNEPCIYSPFTGNHQSEQSAIPQNEIQQIEMAWQERATMHYEYMDVELYTTILEKLSKNSEHAVLTLGYAGELATHPTVEYLLYFASMCFSEVYIETKGRDWNYENEQWWNEAWVKKLKWIIQLDSLDEELYAQIHNGKNNVIVLDFLRFLSEKTSKDNIYVQTTRMNINEGELPVLHAFCKSEGYHLLIQKYNDYCGVLQNRKLIDLHPRNRFACRHLERDMLIRLNGDVQLCTQDIHAKHILGNIACDELDSIQEKKALLFKEQVKEQYKEICKHCDEYYTFNF